MRAERRIVIFAHVPPPVHGQSRMVQQTIEALKSGAPELAIDHVDARFSSSAEGIGSLSFQKATVVLKYIMQGIRLSAGSPKPAFYYIPGPVKWSAVIRDWMILGILRRFFPFVIFHWHAIGQGEWSSGSGRIRLAGPRWMDRIARKLSAVFLSEPNLSICVGNCSTNDAEAVGSHRIQVIPNGIDDPCPDYWTRVSGDRRKAVDRLRAEKPVLRLLYLSRGTVEKGILDTVDVVDRFLASGRFPGTLQLTLAGGVDPELGELFSARLDRLLRSHGERIQVQCLDFVEGPEKRTCFEEHDVFLAMSRWESFGLTVVEAMAFGLPVVAADSDGVRGVLPSGYSYKAEPGNIDSLCGKLIGCFDQIARGDGLHLSEELRSRFEKEFLRELFDRDIAAALRESGAWADEALSDALRPL